MKRQIILRENLQWALRTAIKAQSDYEKKDCGPEFESFLVSGWKIVLEALNKGERVEVVE
jgi:hypothetical protein